MVGPFLLLHVDRPMHIHPMCIHSDHPGYPPQVLTSQRTDKREGAHCGCAQRRVDGLCRMSASMIDAYLAACKACGDRPKEELAAALGGDDGEVCFRLKDMSLVCSLPCCSSATAPPLQPDSASSPVQTVALQPVAVVLQRLALDRHVLSLTLAQRLVGRATPRYTASLRDCGQGTCSPRLSSSSFRSHQRR